MNTLKTVQGTLKENILRNFRYLIAFLSSNRKFQPYPIKVIEVKKEDVNLIYKDTNIIIYFDNKKEKGYFRECRKHLNKLGYLNGLVDDYCYFISTHKEQFKKILIDKLSASKNLFKFFNLGIETNVYSRLNKVFKEKDYSIIGINGDYPVWFGRELLEFVKFSWGAIDEYKYNSYLKNGELQTFYSIRSIVTKKIVDYLGYDDIVPNTYFAILKIDNIMKFGIIEDPTNGIDISKIESNSLAINGNCQRELLCLNIVDIICYQKDHKPENYHIKMQKNIINGISTFDNDCPTSFYISGSIRFKNYFDSNSIVDKQNCFNRPYVDINLYNNMYKFYKNLQDSDLNNYLSIIQLFFVKKRTYKLLCSIVKSLEKGNTNLIKNEEWNEKTIEEEISGNWGDTYLTILNKTINQDNNIHEIL